MNRFNVEGFDTSADNYAAQARIFSDLELQAFLSEPQTSTATLESNINKTTNVIINDKKALMNSLSDGINAADKNVENTAYYLSRSKDLVNLATDVESIASGQINSVSINKNLTLRQAEINEWSNFSKLEVLYFMQIIFISLSFIAILSYLLSVSYISSSLFWMLVSVIVVFDLIIILLKLRFTMVNRDGRYWHKMRFATQPNLPASP
jgi:hypothetical protein